jgi:hypothetical protein
LTSILAKFKDYKIAILGRMRTNIEWYDLYGYVTLMRNFQDLIQLSGHDRCATDAPPQHCLVNQYAIARPTLLPKD